MGKDSPPPPDYTAAAEATGQSQIDAIHEQTAANRPNINTPWGSMTWTQAPGQTVFDETGYNRAMADYTTALNQYNTRNSSGEIGAKGAMGPAPIAPDRNSFYTTTGAGGWTGQVNLTPEAQAALSAQQRIQAGRSSAAESLLGQAQAGFQTPMNWGGLPARSGAIQGAQFSGDLPEGGQGIRSELMGGGDIGDWRQRAQEATWEAMQPMLDRSRNRTENQLANQGITRGSEAWSAAQSDLGDAEARARLAAIESGRQEANMLFGQDLQAGQFENSAQQQEFGQLLAAAQAGDQRALQQVQSALSAGTFNNLNRSQALQEEQTRRSQPLNELNALLTGQQVQNPNIPAFAQAGAGRGTDYMSAVNSQYGAALDASNASNAATGQTIGALGSLAAMFMFSDVRLKTDIRQVGVTKQGIKIYSYRIKGDSRRRIGVLAQQVRKVNPKIVRRDPASGMLQVNYMEIR